MEHEEQWITDVPYSFQIKIHGNNTRNKNWSCDRYIRWISLHFSESDWNFTYPSLHFDEHKSVSDSFPQYFHLIFRRILICFALSHGLDQDEVLNMSMYYFESRISHSWHIVMFARGGHNVCRSYGGLWPNVRNWSFEKVYL